MSKNYTVKWSLNVGNEFNRMVNAKVAKEAEVTRRAAGFAAFKAADAMRDKILNSPTATEWHKRINKERGNPEGARYETGTMFESVSRTYGKIVANADRRKQSSVVASFGWPAAEDGTIKDAPMNPMTKGTRRPDGPQWSQPGWGWRSDPRYFLMQEYDKQYDGNPEITKGMHAQRAGVEAAKIAMDAFFAKRGYK
jgi:hypothetical protein